jgi:hypothetical protein
MAVSGGIGRRREASGGVGWRREASSTKSTALHAVRN